MSNPEQFELPGAEAAFNLAGEETIDGAKVQAEAEAAAQAAAEAQAKQDREQLSLSEDWRVKTWPDGHRAECLYIGGQYVGESREPGKHEAQTVAAAPHPRFTYPRKRHAHRCPVCRTSVACYKKHCPKGPRITIEQCQFHSPVRSPYAS